MRRRCARHHRRGARHGRRPVGRAPRRWSRCTRASAGAGRSWRARADAFAAGLLALGLEPGERIGIWSPNCAEWVVTPVRRRQGRADPGDHQPGLSALRAGIHAEQGRGESAGGGRAVQDQRLCRHGRDPGPGAGGRGPGALAAARVPSCRPAIKIGGERRPGWLDFDDVPGLAEPEHEARLAQIARAARPQRRRSTSSSPAAPPACPRARR